MEKFKKGDRCRIMGNSNGHNFNFKQEVEIDGKTDEDGCYQAWNLDHSDWWWVNPKDMELIAPELKATELTLQEKFEQGWSMVNKHTSSVIIDLHVMKNNSISVVYYEVDGCDSFYSEDNFLAHHTITPPAPKVEKMFTSVYISGNYAQTHFDYKTLEYAKDNLQENTTCILEHEKQGDKWVFVKAHNI